MTKPAVTPTWATDTNFASGPYNGSPTKVAPSVGQAAQGHIPGSKFRSGFVNYTLYHICQWLGWLDAGTAENIDDLSLSVYGDGSDGALTASSGTTTLSRDTYYTNITLSGTAVLDPNGYRVFANGIVTLSGTAAIRSNGGDASGATAGAPAYTNGTLGIPSLAGPGSTTNGTGGAPLTVCRGGASGAGGDGLSGTGGTGGTATAPTAVMGGYRHAPANLGYIFGTGAGTVLMSLIRPGCGGGGGGGSTGDVGGGGGGGGGVICLAAKQIITDVGTIIAAQGGDGADGANNNCGGGGGGGGGCIFITTRDRSGLAGTVSVAGGGAGLAIFGGAGVSGTNGAAGNIHYFTL